jgi:hypothetical protein
MEHQLNNVLSFLDLFETTLKNSVPVPTEIKIKSGPPDDDDEQLLIDNFPRDLSQVDFDRVPESIKKIKIFCEEINKEKNNIIFFKYKNLLERFKTLTISIYIFLYSTNDSITHEVNGVQQPFLFDNSKPYFFEVTDKIRTAFEVIISQYIEDDDSFFYKDYLHKLFDKLDKSDNPAFDKDLKIAIKRNFLYFYNAFIYDPFEPKPEHNYQTKKPLEKIEYIRDNYGGRRKKILVLVEYMKYYLKQFTDKNKDHPNYFLFFDFRHFELYLIDFINHINEELKDYPFLLFTLPKNSSDGILFLTNLSYKLTYFYKIIKIKCDHIECKKQYKYFQNFEDLIIKYIKEKKDISQLKKYIPNEIALFQNIINNFKKSNEDVDYFDILFEDINDNYAPQSLLNKWKPYESGIKYLHNTLKKTKEIQKLKAEQLLEIVKLTNTLAITKFDSQREIRLKNEIDEKIKEFLKENQQMKGGSYTRKINHKTRFTRKISHRY